MFSHITHGQKYKYKCNGRRDKLDLRYSLFQSLCSLLITYVICMKIQYIDMHCVLGRLSSKGTTFRLIRYQSMKVLGFLERHISSSIAVFSNQIHMAVYLSVRKLR